jgi:adenosylcobinamide-GDP ribazoletransferase
MIVPALSRSAMMIGIRALPYARGGEGTGSPFFETPLSMMEFKYVAAPVALSLFLGWRGLLMNLFLSCHDCTPHLVLPPKTGRHHR